MEPTKPFYLSRTFWGAIVALVAAALGLVGREMPAETAGLLADDAVQLASALVTVVGSAFAIYGRFKAKKKIKL